MAVLSREELRSFCLYDGAPARVWKHSTVQRQVSLIFIGLSFIGWILFVAGFGTNTKETRDNIDPDYNPADDPNLYAFWAASIVGPVVHILAVVHAFLWGFPSSIVGSITALLSVMYMTAIGFGMVLYGIFIDNADGEVEGLYKNSTNLFFSGGFLSALSWAIHLAFWPWFKKESSRRGDYSTI